MKTVRLDTRTQAWGITVLRVVVGVVFFAHGWQKFFSYGVEGTAGAFEQMGIPLPAVAALLAATTELLGGAALILGLGTRLAALPLAFVMLIALTQVHLAAGFFLPNGYEFVLTLLAANAALVLLGPGRLALDNRIGGAEEPAPGRAPRNPFGLVPDAGETH